MQKTDNFNYSQVLQKIEALEKDLENKRQAEMGSLIDGFLSEAKQYRYSDDELLTEIRKKLGGKPSKTVKKPAGSGALVGWVTGDTYVNPENLAETWVGGKRGPKPTWLVAQFNDGMQPDKMANKFLELKKSN